jgi:hypothetical protein
MLLVWEDWKDSHLEYLPFASFAMSCLSGPLREMALTPCLLCDELSLRSLREISVSSPPTHRGFTTF